MTLLLYPLFAALAFTFQLLLIATAATLYAGAWLVVVLAAIAARLIGSAWRPRKPRYRGRSRSSTPQAAFSDRR